MKQNIGFKVTEMNKDIAKIKNDVRLEIGGTLQSAFIEYYPEIILRAKQETYVKLEKSAFMEHLTELQLSEYNEIKQHDLKSIYTTHSR